VLARRTVAVLGLGLTAGWTLWMLAVVGDGLAFRTTRPAYLPWLALALVAVVVVGVATTRMRAALLRRDAARAGFAVPEPTAARASLLVWASVIGALLLVAISQLPSGTTGPRVLSVLAAATATGIPFALAGANRQHFEQYRARLGGTGVARDRRRLRDEETLGASCFYDHPKESSGLLLGHGLIALTLLGIALARTLAIEARHSAQHRFLDLQDATGAPFLGRALLLVGLVQTTLIVVLAVAGSLGATRASAGRSSAGRSGTVNAVVNALRPAAMAGTGVFLFTTAVGGLDALVFAGLHHHDINLASFPQLDLVPAFLWGSGVSAVLASALALRRYRIEQPPAELDRRQQRSYRLLRTTRWVIGAVDRLLVMTLLIATGFLLAAGRLHHLAGWHPGLIPQGRFLTPEDWVFTVAPAIGVAAIALPVVLAVVGATDLLRLRSPIASVWDVLAFWPRRFHPLGVPPETERTVPEVQAHLLAALEPERVAPEVDAAGRPVIDEPRVEIVAHSQGSVIAFAALVGLRDRSALDRVSLVTLGSPLFALYPRLFPAQVSPQLTAELVRDLGGLDEPGARWRNLRRRTDYFGLVPGDERELDPPPELLPILGSHGPDERAEVLAHSQYLGLAEVETAVADEAGLLATHPSCPRQPALDSFARRTKMVSWFDPRLLALAGYRAAMAAIFGKWADARLTEVTGPADSGVIDLRPPVGQPAWDDLWLDFVADPGDAFAPTIAVAAAVSRSALHVGGVLLPHADVLVLGGDEVYPVAGLERYQNQLLGPYGLAARCTHDGTPSRNRVLLALPGNHDWYDGLTSFQQIFCASERLAGWDTVQDRSYWAVLLPTAPTEEDGATERPGGRWWLWGVDLQLGGTFDEHQSGYFRQVSAGLRPGDRIILCSPVPTWVHAGGDPMAFDPLRTLIEEAVVPQGAQVVLHLSGDSHQYARYERPHLDPTDPRPVVQHVTAGGGGAFTHPTHHLPAAIELPVGYEPLSPALRLVDDRDAHPHPSAAQSRRLIARSLWLPGFLRQNLGFLLIPGIVAAITTYTSAFGTHRVATRLDPRGLRTAASHLATSSLSVTLLVLTVLGWSAFAKPDPGRSRIGPRLAGVAHGAAQGAGVIVTAWWVPHAAAWLHRHAAHPARQLFSATSIGNSFAGFVDRVTVLGLAGLAGGLLGAALLALYLVASNLLLGIHDNEAASAVADQGAKHFVRLHLQGGTAEAWVLGVGKVAETARLFNEHDPRPVDLDHDGRGPEVELWDRFTVGGPEVG
jgi:hypothetical protein